jgi:hypothetical protein
MDAQEWLEQEFLHLKNEYYLVTSDATDEYNCIAWAANDTERWWWPHPDAYWPPSLPCIATLENFIRAFQTLGYEPCEDGTLETGWTKVAIYLNAQGIPTHMARQLPSGQWTSKLGEAWDIEHQSVLGVEGNIYGQVGQYLKQSLLPS